MFKTIKKHIKLFLFIFLILILNILFNYTNQFQIIEIIYQVLSFLTIIGIAIYYVNKFDNVTLKSFTCPLTKIYTRNKYFNIMEIEIKRSERTNGNLSAIFFDIDNFASINTKLGHYTGDRVLIDMVNSIKECLRSYDIFARVGGEEFSVLMPETDVNEAYLIAERIRKHVNTIKVGKGLELTISIGVTTLKQEDTPLDIYKRMDDAMYVSKNKGKNQTTIWDNSVVK